MKEILYWLVVVVFWIAIVVYIPDWGFVKGEVTQYSIAPCGDCPTGKMPLNTTKYKPNTDTQEVLSWMPEFGIPVRYTSCAVVSRTDWTCSYNDGSGIFGFNNGIYWDDIPMTEDVNWQYVSRTRYLMVYWG